MAVRGKSTAETNVWPLFEEALHLLRHAPSSAWAAYAIGAVPFVLGLLFFMGEMSQSALAEKHLPTAAFGMALLFLWLKVWQSVFSELMLATHGCRTPEKNSRRRWLYRITLQTAVQPWSLVAVPMSLLIALPFGWVWAFFQNITTLGFSPETSLRAVLKEAWRCACWAPRQNHLLLSALTIVFVAVSINVISAFAFIPFLLKAWFGIHTTFSRSPDAYWNVTFFAVVFTLSWVAVDPLMKAVYALRCFYAQARTSGEDLKMELHRVQRVVVPLLVLWMGLFTSPASVAENVPIRPAPPVAKLDKALDRTLERREFAWRLPREMTSPTDKEDDGFIRAFFDELANTMESWWNNVSSTWKKFKRWLDRVLGRDNPPDLFTDSNEQQDNLHTHVQWLATLLLIGMLVVVLQWFKRRRKRIEQPVTPTVLASDAPAQRPDLQKEEVNPALLPEEEWLALAHDLAARGEWRLALRALYLSALAALARRELLALARGKSNREYARELSRRAHQHPEVLQPFHNLVTDFERVWYGRHPANSELYQKCEQQLSNLQNA